MSIESVGGGGSVQGSSPLSPSISSAQVRITELCFTKTPSLVPAFVPPTLPQTTKEIPKPLVIRLVQVREMLQKNMVQEIARERRSGMLDKKHTVSKGG